MKILDYLYYKLYRAHTKGSIKDIAEFAATINVGTLLAVNIFVILGFLRKIDVLPFFFTGKKQVIVMTIFFFIGCGFLFLYKKRYKQIIIKYEQENERSRKRGNLVVWLYVIISLLLIFAVAFYKPGKV